MSKKKDNNIIKQNKSMESNEYKNLITILIVIVSVFLVMYILTSMFSKKDKDNIFKNDLNTSEIQYSEIMIGTMLNDEEKYVLVVEKDDQYKEIFENYIEKIRNKKTKIYTADLSSAFNKMYVADSSSYDSDNMKFNKTVLLKIEKNKIKEHIENKEDILNQLKELSKDTE